MTAGPGAGEGAVVDLAALARGRTETGAVWAYGGADLNANLVLLEEGAGISGHVNGEVDVLLVGIAGAGFVDVDGRRLTLAAGQALIVPKGARRAIDAVRGQFAYLTCHRRRTPLRPAGVARPRGLGGAPGG